MSSGFSAVRFKSRRTAGNMAGVCLLALIAGLLLEANGLPAAIPEENTGAVFLSQQAANKVLIRQRRFNSGLEEMLHKDNLERECKEETCSMEEAREVFENDEKTMEFWVTYVDGDQCKPPPCQNGGQCQDGINSYVCYCKPNFNGKNCEIEMSKQCSVNNGGCSHFCAMRNEEIVCQCATGYQLAADRMTCEPTAQFSCGRVDSTPSTSTSTSVNRVLLAPRSSHPRAERNHSSSDSLLDDYDDDANITQLYDYYDSAVDSDSGNTSAAEVRSVRSVESSGVTETPTETEKPLSWAFAMLPTISEEKNSDQRIVGGDEASPGQIPWQVALMSHSDVLQRAEPFCGGSLLSEYWVMTAAHCLAPANGQKRKFFVRVGEHDVKTVEVDERDHEVAEQHIHHRYNAKESPYNNDIALLKLATPVELSNKRRPICLGPSDFLDNLLKDPSVSLVSGWGRIKFQGPEATKLQKLEVPYVDRTMCKQSSRDHVTRFMFCAGYKDQKKDSCQGDSGGPHATNYKGTWFLTGIVSWGEECAKDGKYGIYTRVSMYYKWIRRTTGLRITN